MPTPSVPDAQGQQQQKKLTGESTSPKGSRSLQTAKNTGIPLSVSQPVDHYRKNHPLTMGRTGLNSRRKGLTHPVLRIRRGTQHVEIRAHFTRVAARVAARVPGVPGGALWRGAGERSTCAKKLER